MHWKPNICIYHGKCDDGFCSAWAVWKRWGDAIEYVGAVYGKQPPDVAGKHVLMVDFSYKKPIIEEMARKAKSLVILDHHKTAEADLQQWAGAMVRPNDVELFAAKASVETGLPIVAVFDMNQSGARLTWDFCHYIEPNDPPPVIVALIEDRDLWRFSFGEKTKQFSAALRTYPMDFVVWDKIAADPDRLIEEGKIVLRAHLANIEKFLDEAYQEKIGGYEVPCVNVPYHYASDVADALLSRFPDAPFAASWFKRGDGLFQASLRSEDHRLDVSEIAKKYGGGGHRNAAGFQVPSMRGEI